VSILSAFGRRQHLDDNAIAELWSSRTAAGASAYGTTDSLAFEPLPLDAVARGRAAHVDSCSHCRARYEAFADWLADVRADAIGEADEIFSVERLGAQQTQIFRRLETLERPARVIAFPKHSPLLIESRRGPQGWIAAAAAAGLIVGLGAGELLDLRSLHRRSGAGLDATAVTQNVLTNIQTGSLSSDDMLLYDTEAVSTSPRVEALQALDAMTPRVRDVDASR
jgi:hypothetical protein